MVVKSACRAQDLQKSSSCGLDCGNWVSRISEVLNGALERRRSSNGSWPDQLLLLVDLSICWPVDPEEPMSGRQSDGVRPPASHS